jgi:hypothetical protein
MINGLGAERPDFARGRGQEPLYVDQVWALRYAPAVPPNLAFRAAEYTK